MNLFFGGNSFIRGKASPGITPKRDPSTPSRARAKRGKAKPRETPLRMTARAKNLIHTERGELHSHETARRVLLGKLDFAFRRESDYLAPRLFGATLTSGECSPAAAGRRRMPQPGAASVHCTTLQIRGRHRVTS